MMGRQRLDDGDEMRAVETILAGMRGGHWLTAARLKGYALLSAVFSVAVAIGWILLSEKGIDPSGRPIGTDFMNVYAAGLMVLDGQAPLAYDWTAHNAVEQAVIPTGDYYGWHYPPVFLFLAAALAALPYFVALGTYVAATLAGFLATARAIMAGSGVRTGLVLLVAFGFPAVFVNAGHGQNGFLTAALLGLGLLLLPGRPVAAGVMFGLLAYKPQFGLLIPVALLAGGHWRAILSAGATVILTNTAAYLVFGREIFEAFLASTELTRTIVLEQASTGLHKFQSVFAAVQLVGGSLEAAYLAQALALAGAVAAVALVWRVGGDHRTKAAILAFAIPLTTPYLMDYDLTLLGVGIAFLARRGLERGFRPYEISLLAALWTVPMIARSVANVAHLPLTVPLLICAVALLARDALPLRRAGSSSGQPAA